MAEEEKLRLGRGVAFVKSRPKRFPQCDETWEVDFQALPQPITQAQAHDLGMVVTEKDGSLLADMTVHGRPSVNDLATLLAQAMRHPLKGDARRCKKPRRCRWPDPFRDEVLARLLDLNHRRAEQEAFSSAVAEKSKPGRNKMSPSGRGREPDHKNPRLPGIE